ncbi:MAG TPA: translocation/assembly module TamB domain-containing protein [Opitutaceae bacterium]
MRRLLFILGGLLAGTMVVLAALPWWLESALRQVGASQGATFARYERLGYARFALTDVELSRPGVKVTIDRLEAPTPLRWLWDHGETDDASEVVAGAWTVVAEPLARTTASPSGWTPLRARLVQVAEGLARWLPLARAGQGEVRWPGGGLRLAGAEWRNGVLTVSSLGYEAIEAKVELRWFAAEDTFTLALAAADADWQAIVRSRADAITGDLTFWDQVARAEATFAPTGWLPVEATATATDWNIAGARLNLDGRYQRVVGSGRITWRDTRLDLDLAANGEPEPGQAAPPLAVALRGGGTTDAFTLSMLDVRIPGMTAHLSAPVSFDPGAGVSGMQSRLTFDANLAELPWAGWRGTVRGEAEVRPVPGAFPRIDATFTLGAMGYGDWEIASASGQVGLEWPQLRLAATEVVSVGGGRLTVRGAWDFQTRSLLDAVVTGTLDRAALARWLPPELRLSTIAVEATASGVWPEIVHSGQVSLTELSRPPLKPVALQGSWRGRGLVWETVEVSAQTQGATLAIAGSLSGDGLSLSAMKLSDQDGRTLTLAAPTRVQWSPKLSVDALHLQGSGTDVKAHWVRAEEDRLTLEIAAFDSRWLEPWVELSGPAWKLGTLRFMGGWSEGPLTFSTDASLEINLSETRTATVDVAATGDAEGVVIRNLQAAEAGAAVIRASGRMPMVIQPLGTPRIQIDGDGPLALTVSSEPNPAFWEKLAELTGVTLRAPQVAANLGGTWSRPQGELNLQAETVTLDAIRSSRPLPEITALALKLTGDGDGVVLDEFTVRVAGQAVRARGRLPLVPTRWSEARQDPRAFLEKGADLRIEIPDAEMAALARYVPGYLAPVGRLQADVSVKPGGLLSGFVRLQDAASRPLGPLGVLQEIGADIRFEGRRIDLRSVQAKAGGQPVVLSGTVALRSGGEPRLDLALRGENLPFVRQTGLLVRGDLDLKLATLTDGRTRISGTTRLRDSLFLADVRSLIPRGGGAGVASRRPPYFAVEAAPLSTWLLDVEVHGERFLRLRTPVFNGTASARFRLGGTLGEPRAVGEATINDGQVRLPFATFAVQQGTVRLTEADPYEPRLAVTGAARRFGYDLRMNLGGTVSAPDLSFTSSPPLDSEQVLLLVMAGEVPGDEIRYSGSQRAVRFGTYLGQGLLGRIGGDTSNADRLSLTTGERVSRQGRETYGFEYKLDDRWSLVGEYDEFDDFNAGVKWRILARKEANDATAP